MFEKSWMNYASSRMRLLHHGISKYRPDGKLGPACWPHFDLLVVLGGSFHFDHPPGELTAIAGDALLVPKGVRFRGRTSSLGGTLWVHHFRPGKTPAEKWLHRLPARAMALFSGGASTAWNQALLTRIHEIHPHSDFRAEQTLLFKMLLDQIRRSPTKGKSSVIQKVLQAAQASQWKDITIAGMAKEAQLSESHFRAKFRAEIGETVGDYLKARRLECAMEALRTAETPIKEISREAGYSETSAFYHAFRKAAGCSPAQFRKRHPHVV